MKTRSRFGCLALIAFALVGLAAPGLAAPATGNSAPTAGAAVALVKPDDASVSADWLAQARAGYPLSLCVVSEEKLEDGDMGPPEDYVVRQAGAPDRLVRFCCNHCIRDFKKEPASYLKKIDDAAAAKAKQTQ